MVLLCVVVCCFDNGLFKGCGMFYCCVFCCYCVCVVIVDVCVVVVFVKYIVGYGVCCGRNDGDDIWGGILELRGIGGAVRVLRFKYRDGGG